MGKLRVGQVYRYARPYRPEPAEIDGYTNYFHAANSEGFPLPLLEKGINGIGRVQSDSGPVSPAILISSSPHKAGSEGTPWQDLFDADNGYIRYFGDNRSTGPAGTAPGNKLLLEQFRLHSSPDRADRKQAVPILFFERVAVGGRSHGSVRFWGLGVIQSVQVITQYQEKIGYFSNYQYEFAVLSLRDENEEFDWEWVTARRNGGEMSQYNSFAPTSWRKWVRDGQMALESNRRSVSKMLVVSKEDQIPVPNSRESKCLKEIYDFYTIGKKHQFELLASRVVQGIVSRSGANFHEGWITKASGDGGVDFVGRIDLGQGFSTVKVLVLGQAKCESPRTPTNGRDIARTVARLRRGWIGAYVTTSYFSDKVQIEIHEDQYPLITVSGRQLAEETLRLMEESGFTQVVNFLVHLEEQYPSNVLARRPEEILLD